MMADADDSRVDLLEQKVCCSWYSGYHDASHTESRPLPSPTGAPLGNSMEKPSCL